MSSLWGFLTGIARDVNHVFQNTDPPEPGDMIQFQMSLGFQHWGIYVGNGEVVHFAWPAVSINPIKYRVQKEKVKDVKLVVKYAVWNKFDKEHRPLDPDRVVKRALHMVGKDLIYDARTANCEHFATLMRYDVAISEQAERFNYTVDPNFVKAVKRYLLEIEKK